VNLDVPFKGGHAGKANHLTPCSLLLLDHSKDLVLNVRAADQLFDTFRIKVVFLAFGIKFFENFLLEDILFPFLTNLFDLQTRNGL